MCEYVVRGGRWAVHDRGGDARWDARGPAHARVVVGSSPEEAEAAEEAEDMAREGDDATAVGAVARVVVAFCAGASVAVGADVDARARRRRTEEANDARERETTATRERCGRW